MLSDLNTDGKWEGGGGKKEEDGTSTPVRLGVKERGGRKFDKTSISFAKHNQSL